MTLFSLVTPYAAVKVKGQGPEAAATRLQNRFPVPESGSAVFKTSRVKITLLRLKIARLCVYVCVCVCEFFSLSHSFSTLEAVAHLVPGRLRRKN